MNGRNLDDHDLLVDDRDLLNHHGYTTNDHRDHRDLLTVDRDLLTDDRDYLMGDRDCPKDGHYLDGHYLDGHYLDGHYLDDHGLRLVCLNDRQLHQHRRDGQDAMVCRILLPVADDVDRDFLGLALDEVYLQTTRKRRTCATCE